MYFRDGYLAAQNNKSLEDNPYEIETHPYVDWGSGFIAYGMGFSREKIELGEKFIPLLKRLVGDIDYDIYKSIFIYRDWEGNTSESYPDVVWELVEIIGEYVC